MKLCSKAISFESLLMLVKSIEDIDLAVANSTMCEYTIDHDAYV